jgi:hypothetical protein
VKGGEKMTIFEAVRKDKLNQLKAESKLRNMAKDNMKKLKNTPVFCVFKREKIYRRQLQILNAAAWLEAMSAMEYQVKYDDARFALFEAEDKIWVVQDKLDDICEKIRYKNGCWYGDLLALMREFKES